MTMLRRIGVMVSVGLADSLNPSTIGPALYLTTAARGAWRVTQFTIGVFVVNLLGRRGLARRRLPVAAGGGSALIAGASIAAVELPTAAPYFAVIAGLVASDASVTQQVGTGLVRA